MNRAELRAEIAKKMITQREIASALGISESSLRNKMVGDNEFKESEIRKLVQLLELSPERVNEIFLT